MPGPLAWSNVDRSEFVRPTCCCCFVLSFAFSVYVHDTSVLHFFSVLFLHFCAVFLKKYHSGLFERQTLRSLWGLFSVDILCFFFVFNDWYLCIWYMSYAWASSWSYFTFCSVPAPGKMMTLMFVLLCYRFCFAVLMAYLSLFFPFFGVWGLYLWYFGVCKRLILSLCFHYRVKAKNYATVFCFVQCFDFLAFEYIHILSPTCEFVPRFDVISH